VFVIASAVGVFLLLTIRLWSYVVDDAFISLRYAKHLAEGQGLVYNIGERVEGYTNLLWTLLLSLAHLLPGDVVIWTKLFSVAAALVQRARGATGTNLAYVQNTVAHLRKLGLRDRALDELTRLASGAAR
jgi:hypothetical protein